MSRKTLKRINPSSNRKYVLGDVLGEGNLPRDRARARERARAPVPVRGAPPRPAVQYKCS